MSGRAAGATTAIDAYYDAWKSGIGSFDPKALERVLAEDLDFEGPIAGRRRGSAGFVVGLRRFVEGLQEPIAIVQRVISEEAGAVIYDAVIPQGKMRFAEFFRVEGGRIRSLTLLYDANQYRSLGGR